MQMRFFLITLMARRKKSMKTSSRSTMRMKGKQMMDLVADSRHQEMPM